MKCPTCKHEFRGGNQHSGCPACGATAGDISKRDGEATWRAGVKQFQAWHDATRDNLSEQNKDVGYLDGYQWTPEEINELKARNQAPTVFNRIAKKINYIRGMEQETRTDPKCLPRTQASDDDVRAATDALRYVQDAEDLPSVFSACWSDLIVAGQCGAILQIQTPDDSGAEGMPQGRAEIGVNHIFWDRLWWDQHSRRPDYSDGRHKGLFTWHDLDAAIDVYKNVTGVVDNFEDILSATDDMGRSGATIDDVPNYTLWYDDERQRIRTIEKYYKDGDGNWYVCHFTAGGLLVYPQLTGYIDENGRHICPLVMDSCNVDRDGNRYGLIRNMRDPQSLLNKSFSKTIHLLSVDRTIAEEGVVESPEEFQQERAKPDGYAVVRPGALQRREIVTESGVALAQGYSQVMQEAKGQIDSTGPDAPMIGMSNATSGRQVQYQQHIGSIEIRPFLERLRKLRKSIYRLCWLGIRQSWTDELWFRVTDDEESTGYKFVGINRQVTKGQRAKEMIDAGVDPMAALKAVDVDPSIVQRHMQMLQGSVQPGTQPDQITQLLIQHVAADPEMQQPIVVNNISKLVLDIAIEETPDTAVVQQEEAAELRELLTTIISSVGPGAPPGLVTGLLKMQVEAGGLRNKRKLLALIEPEPDKQASAQAQIMQQMQQTMLQIQAQLAQAKVDETKASAQLKQAQSVEVQTQAQLNQVRSQVEPIKVQSEAQRDQATAVMHGVKAGADMAGPIPKI